MTDQAVALPVPGGRARSRAHDAGDARPRVRGVRGQTLESLLAEDVALHGDGGGRAPTLARALYGRRRVARRLASWIKIGRRSGGIEVRRAEVNGQK